MALVRIRQVVAVCESNDRMFQCIVDRDRGHWPVEGGGRCIQVVVNKETLNAQHIYTYLRRGPVVLMFCSELRSQSFFDTNENSHCTHWL